MATEMRRTMLSIPKEFEAALLKLKKEKFYNTTQSEMLRHLINLGLEAERIKTTDEILGRTPPQSQQSQSAVGE